MAEIDELKRISREAQAKMQRVITRGIPAGINTLADGEAAIREAFTAEAEVVQARQRAELEGAIRQAIGQMHETARQIRGNANAVERLRHTTSNMN